MSDRLKALEEQLGAPLPSDYASFLQTHAAADKRGCFISSNPEYWGVRSLLELAVGPRNHQLDEVFRIVRDAIPAGTLPIAKDWAGNLYLLVCVGPAAGEVVWWDHERDEGDTNVEHVAHSFTEFTELLAYEEES
jgi:hypothetical protein